MADSINVLVNTFPGLAPKTLCFSLPPTATTDSLLNAVTSRLPSGLTLGTKLSLSSQTHGPLLPSQTTTLKNLLCNFSPQLRCSSRDVSLITLHLHPSLPGGKGGFGSQLRAAGGRMSSRKKKQNAELATGSARNLDGRRLRTITEAKNLAAYMATKPDMDRKEKEERRKRWETVVELAEQRERDMRSGKGKDGVRKGVSEEWKAEKEEVGEGVRSAVKLAMLGSSADGGEDRKKPRDQESSAGSGASGQEGSEEDSDAEEENLIELGEEDMARLRAEAERGDADAIWVLKQRLKIPEKYLPQKKVPQRKFVGFDDDDDDDDDSDDDHDLDDDQTEKEILSNPTEANDNGKGKGKGKKIILLQLA